MSEEDLYLKTESEGAEPLEPDVLLGPDTFDALKFGLRFNSGDLDPSFSAKRTELIAECQNRGAAMVTYTGIRDPWEQARLWRRSRTTNQVNQAISKLKSDGAPFLARVLDEVGPQPSGPKVTGALPGFSWHQWGESADSYWLVNGRANWSPTQIINGINGYQVYAEEAVKLGLTAGGYWQNFKDWPHVQLRSAANPSAMHTVPEINDAMVARFGGDAFQVFIN